MAVAVIADAHIGGPGGPAEPLVRQLRDLPDRGCRHLLLLGDLFHVWVGDRRYETGDIRAVADTLAGLKQRGLRIDYVEGNRDFFIAESPYAELFHRVDREARFTAGGRRYLAVHGDGLNERDHLYRFWRWLSKSPPSRFFWRHLPSSVAGALAERTERQLAGTNFKHKTRIPEEMILRYARRRLGAGYDVLLLGHFHRPRRWRMDGGEVRLLDAWFRSRSPEWFGTS